MNRYRVTVDGRIYDVEIDDPHARPVTARLSGFAFSVDVEPAREEDDEWTDEDAVACYEECLEAGGDEASCRERAAEACP